MKCEFFVNYVLLYQQDRKYIARNQHPRSDKFIINFDSTSQRINIHNSDKFSESGIAINHSGLTVNFCVPRTFNHTLLAIQLNILQCAFIPAKVLLHSSAL